MDRNCLTEEEEKTTLAGRLILSRNCASREATCQLYDDSQQLLSGYRVPDTAAGVLPGLLNESPFGRDTKFCFTEETHIKYVVSQGCREPQLRQSFKGRE